MASFLPMTIKEEAMFLFAEFSSLSESGFIPTDSQQPGQKVVPEVVLISFREWLHSYLYKKNGFMCSAVKSSHLFQRVASFLHDSEFTK